MDQESIVYGCIKDANDYDSTDVGRRVANRDAMLSLPKADGWPFLCQEMFALPKTAIGQDNYQTDVMHFGASYKAIEYEWEQWINKFEELLSQMYWVSATVHLETELSGTHTFTWESSSNSHVPGNSDMQVRCEWSHEGSLGI
jgi:hypothetical protein